MALKRILSCKKQIASLGSIQDTGCLGLVHWDDPERLYRVGGEFRVGNSCTPMADSCQCMAKPIQYCKVKKKLKKKKKESERVSGSVVSDSLQSYGL